ncbi:hypothetical protein ATE68_00185 [Sphingopyxis sp. H038]|uniref:lasso peptide biosynthesis B2 protein n=1 Tax=unclassified Sphingopyxis TaxID=2614943 RepID=UPI00073158DB|nr:MULTISPECIES: lasso peptide biosynthesis B2 protein [unclassified Sphingopyxis]KTE04125.1 hypothetical protein ATE78_00185 [Sphingopyxis sp. H012]KTE06029.1 hypothetical protein ATE70_23015 [Sphingopyxis sp. H053]KTE36614.1 hypothetical protein ATE68_00185 [Sphingopyxis sp. H038]KTE47346.1 hypothetical protein ATE77_03245 [Sphingopyxis sp. H005]KTE49053.1 hypothetical protein ATE73_00190 [Sphingopyxis sp. H077]
MPLRLRDDLYFCICSGRAVFLDVGADRYFQLPVHQDLAFQRFASGQAPQPGDETTLEAMAISGLMVDAHHGARTFSPVTVSPPMAEIDPMLSMARLTDRLAALLSVHRARRALAKRPLKNLFDTMSRSSAALVPDRIEDWTAVNRVAAAFAVNGIMIRRQDQCLPLSIAFKHLCLARRTPTTLVIGVKLDPFVAHCWIQRDEYVVNDTLERVRLFTPILAL